MPLTITASWPSLTEGKKAKASEVEAKFDWLEGNQLPMIGGALTTGVYDMGTATYRWRNGYFNSLVIGGVTMTSAEAGGTPVRAWAYLNYVGGTCTVIDSFNVALVITGTPGATQVFWDNDFIGDNRSAVIATPISAGGFNSTCQFAGAGSAIINTTNLSGVLTGSSFMVIAAGSV